MSDRLTKFLISLVVVIALSFCFVLNRIEAAIVSFDVAPKMVTALELAGAKIVIPEKPQSGSFKDLKRFRFDDCAFPFLIMPISLNLSSNSMFDGIQDLKVTTYHRYNVYFGAVTAPVGALSLQMQRLKYSMLFLFGYSPYVPAPYALYVLAPEACKFEGRVDWHSVWQDGAASEL